MNKLCASRAPATIYFSCAVAFIAIGVTQPAFLGVGFAFLGLAIAMLRKKPSP